MNEIKSIHRLRSKGEAEYIAGYEAMMQYWLVPYESIDIPGYYGRTSGHQQPERCSGAGVAAWWARQSDHVERAYRLISYASHDIYNFQA